MTEHRGGWRRPVSIRAPALDLGQTPLANVRETARALNLMGESYLLDVFGPDPRVSPDTADIRR